MAEEDYELWCICETESRPVKVFISPTKDIYDLTDLIAEKRFSWNYTAGDLILTKINVDNFESTVVAGQFQPGPNDVILHPTSSISDVWPMRPPKGFVHVFVRLGTTVLGKRTRSVDDLDFINRSKLFSIAPCLMGKLSEYESLQWNPFERILDDRPDQDLFPPTSLLYEGFGSFLDIFRRREDVYELTLERRNLEVAVNTFAEAMTSFFKSEDERKTIGLNTLNAILSIGGYDKLAAASVDSSRICSGGHYNGPHGAISCIVEFRNELVDINSIPLVELVSCVAHSHAQSIQSHKDMYMGWRVPCLGLTVVGPYVTFYAVLFFRQLRVVSLTPTLSCITSAGEGDDRKALYAAFEGALTLLGRINEDAKNFIAIPPSLKIPYEDHRLPYVSALPKYDAPGEIRFKILRLHPDKQDYRLLYIAKRLDEERPIMVKFTRRYSIELHAFCAARGNAPSILGYKQIPGGWFVIAMDYISPSMYPSESPDLQSLFASWEEELRKLVQSFHDAGFVHGDLRQPNMLCDGDKLKLIDYDWGGAVGEARYPHARLCSELTDGRAGIDPRITKDDDKRVLENTLDKLMVKAACMVPR